MHPAGVVVIVVILALFAAAVALLCYVAARYKHLQDMIGEDAEENDFLSYTIREYAAAYKRFGQDVNTPGIIADAMGVRLTGLLFAERFLNNAVSLFVTLGLFGTFLGLSLSVTALTQLIRYSNTSEWLSVLDSVGGGLMSALAGMGVAFYTSLVGAGCSILLTVLRTVISPQARREQLATALELWLDHDVPLRCRKPPTAPRPLCARRWRAASPIWWPSIRPWRNSTPACATSVRWTITCADRWSGWMWPCAT